MYLLEECYTPLEIIVMKTTGCHGKCLWNNAKLKRLVIYGIISVLKNSYIKNVNFNK